VDVKNNINSKHTLEQPKKAFVQSTDGCGLELNCHETPTVRMTQRVPYSICSNAVMLGHDSP